MTDGRDATLVPRRVARPRPPRPSTTGVSHAQRVRLVASATFSTSLSTDQSNKVDAPSTSKTPTAVLPAWSDLPPARREAVDKLADCLFTLLSPLALGTRSHDQEWTQRIIASSTNDGARVHVTRLLQLRQVRDVCQSSVEVCLALRRLEALRWFDMSEDGYTFSLRRAIGEDIGGEPGRLWRKLVDEDRIVYLEDLPPSVTTQRQASELVLSHLHASSLADGAATAESNTVYDVYAPTKDTMPPWLSVSSFPARKQGNAIRFGQAFAVLSSSQAARTLTEAIPWCLQDVQLVNTDARGALSGQSKGRKRTAMRSLSLKAWLAMRDEYFAWRSRILELNRSASALSRHDERGAAANVSSSVIASGTRQADTMPADPSPATSIPDEDPTAPHPIGTILVLSHLALFPASASSAIPSEQDLSEASRKVKAGLEKLLPASVGYVDIHLSPTDGDAGTGDRDMGGSARCYVRTPTRFVAAQLADLVVAAVRGGADGRQRQLAFATPRTAVRILRGEEEGGYWSRVPVKTRNAAKKRALAAAAPAHPPLSDSSAVQTKGDENSSASQKQGQGQRTKKRRLNHADQPTGSMDPAERRHVVFADDDM